jgi:hypothetical protein
MAGRCTQVAPTVGPSGEVAPEGALAIEVDAPAATRTLADLPLNVETVGANRGVVGLCSSLEVAHAAQGRYRREHPD